MAISFPTQGLQGQRTSEGSQGVFLTYFLSNFFYFFMFNIILPPLHASESALNKTIQVKRVCGAHFHSVFENFVE